MTRLTSLLAAVALVAAPATSWAQDAELVLNAGTPSPTLTTAGLALLSLLPFALVIMTSFAKIAVVLSLLRSALGAQNLPPNMVITSLAIALSVFVMAPVVEQMTAAAAPLLDASRDQLRDLSYVTTVAEEIMAPWRSFLALNAGEAELTLFADLRGIELPAHIEETPLMIAIPAFAVTELAEAFQIGFLIFLPFLVLDMLVGSVLLSLGMHMLSPTSVSLPFKLLLFVLINGWLVLSQSLILGYTHAVGGGG